MRRLVILSLVAASAAALTGCPGDAVNTNANIKVNANAANNTIIVTNANNTSTVNTNRWSNTNITREEYDKNRADYEKEKGTSTIGQGANDSWIWFKTRAALLAANDLRESTINVDVVNDVITLKGTVANAAQKTKAETVAKGIEGQKGVKNELKVAPADSMTNTDAMTDSDKKANTNMNKK